jgi:methionine-S-sulfoxide reductase
MANQDQQVAVFAAGCFWGVQDYFDQIPGVINTRVGYTGGITNNPTYEQVCTGQTNHAEAIEVTFDEDIVSYRTLLEHFFILHDPTQLNRQGPDVGTQYRSAIFTQDEQQMSEANQFIDSIKNKYSSAIVTEISPAEKFFEAEDYHQKFTSKTGRGGCHVKYRPLN